MSKSEVDDFGIATFGDLDEAYAFVQESPPTSHPRIFALETNKAGSRTFLVGSYKSFSKFYLSIKPEEAKHYNEVLVDLEPCRPYCEVKFTKSLNPHLDGASLTQAFAQFVCDQLNHYFGVFCTLEDVVQLDASTEAKFHRRLIFHLPDGKVFENHLSVGRFIAMCCEDLLEMRREMKRPSLFAKDFLIKKQVRGKVDEVPFCDVTSTFMQRQNLYLYQSSQYGSNVPYLVPYDCQFPFPDPRRHVAFESAVFKNSLVQVLEYRIKDLLRFDAFPIKQGLCEEIGSHVEKLVGIEKSSFRCIGFKTGELVQFTFGKFHLDAKGHKKRVHVNLREMVMYATCFDGECRRKLGEHRVELEFSKTLYGEAQKIWKMIYGNKAFAPCYHKSVQSSFSMDEFLGKFQETKIVKDGKEEDEK